VISRPSPPPRSSRRLKRPPLHKVILINDDYTPREFVVMVLEGRLPDERGSGLQGDDHRPPARRLRGRGLRQDIAESKATEATDLGRQAGFPLMFTTEPEE
jgi:ATP-dependent Clp protease adaptor protein ClpS